MKYIILVIIIFGILYYFAMPSSNDKDASAEIETLLNNIIESAERKNIDVVMEYFSPDYKDSSARTYPAVKNIVESAFERFDEINGGYSGLIVSTTENEKGDVETRANLDIWVSGKRSGTTYKLIGSKDDPQNADIVFERVIFGGWKILSVEGIK